MKPNQDNGLYPLGKPYHQGYLDVSHGHRLYYEQSGNPDGIPAVYLHGGPGAGGNASQGRYFDPDQYCITLFDQRGAGKSTPFASTHHNTTDYLVADIEALRKHLGHEKWLVAGGSWGVTLALTYGTRHPQQCLGFLLRGVFLGTPPEVDWFLHRMGTFFPEAYDDFIEHISPQNGKSVLDAYSDRLFSPDPELNLPAAMAWARYETRCSSLIPEDVQDLNRESSKVFSHFALSISRIEAHYLNHQLFLEPDELLQNISAIGHLPALIVQGRYDVVCPITTAHRLHRAWESSQLVVVKDAGHSGMEPGIARAMTVGANTLIDLIS